MSAERELEALFRAERAVRPTTDSVNQGWQRLAMDLAANVAPLPVATGSLKLGVWLVPKWLLLGFAVGMVGAGAASPLFGAAKPRVSLAAVSTRVDTPNGQARPAQRVPSVKEDRPLPPAASGAIPRVHDSSALPVGPSPSSASSLDAELELISFAKSALEAHRLPETQALLTVHAQRFPNGVFAVEREALSVLARCEQGPRDPALARSFAKRHPGSPLAARLERSCDAGAVFSNSRNGAAGLGEPITERSRGD